MLKRVTNRHSAKVILTYYTEDQPSVAKVIWCLSTEDAHTQMKTRDDVFGIRYAYISTVAQMYYNKT